MKPVLTSAIVITIGLATLAATTSVEAKGTRQVARGGYRLAKADSQPAKPAPRKSASHEVGAVPNDISPEAAEVVWLYHHGFSSEELLHYVEKSHADFKVTVDDVSYLKHVGISTDVVVAMIRPPQARENIARLRQRLPGWAQYALYSKAEDGPRDGSDEAVAEGLLQSQTTETPSESDILNPNHYDPYFHRNYPSQGYPYPAPTPGLAPYLDYRYGPAYPYGGYFDYRNGPYNGYDRRYLP